MQQYIHITFPVPIWLKMAFLRVPASQPVAGTSARYVYGVHSIHEEIVPAKRGLPLYQALVNSFWQKEDPYQ